MKKTYLYIVVSAMFLLPAAAFAADATISSTPKQVGVGDRVAVTLSVSTLEALNSFSGALTYDSALLTPAGVSDGNSISSVWLTRPVTGATSTPFVGFAPGGFIGKGDLFTVIFTARAAGTARFTLTNPQFLRNDGQGTAEPVTLHPLTLQVSGTAQGGYTEPSDVIPPDPFTLKLGKDTAVFGGRAYLAFAPVDKGSGVDRIEVGETRLPFVSPSFAPAHSPYELKDQYLTSRVVVRAYDRAGNVQVSVFPRTHLFRPYELIILATLVAALLLWLYFTKHRLA